MHLTASDILKKSWSLVVSARALRAVHLLLCWALLSAGNNVHAADYSIDSLPAALRSALPPVLTDADFRPYDTGRAALGQLLFYDKILSGNRNISCADCHHPRFGTSDGLSLGVGEGGVGLGPDREIPDDEQRPLKRVPRNATALFNLGHREINIVFHDGRVAAADTYGNGFDSPAQEWLPAGLQSVIAAQALMPLVSVVEMAGDGLENAVSTATNVRIDLGWPIVAERVATIDQYARQFIELWADIDKPQDISIVHIANALDDFINSEWRTANSAFDAFLQGEPDALSKQQLDGLVLFYGKAGCSQCHSGALLSDRQFYALALPPLGPGRLRLHDPLNRDTGRIAATDKLDDAYRFMTPSLRNVAATGPWGHNGAYTSLHGIIKHHLDPLQALQHWDRSQVLLPKDEIFEKKDFLIWADSREMQRLRARIDIQPVALAEEEVTSLVAFLHGLTDRGNSESMVAGRLGVPDSVPSNLPLD